MKAVEACIGLTAVGTTIWVGIDASRRDWGNGSGTATWVLGCILLWIVIFPYYLVRHGRAPLKHAVAGAMYRECPHCKEPVRRDAGICPHCRLPSTAWEHHDDRWWYRASEQEPWQWLDEANGGWVQIDS